VRLRFIVSLCLVATLPRTTTAQLPLAPLAKSGQTVTPAFEGWYRNPDGSFSISFGYYNRNTAEVIEIPVGADNFIAPGDSNQGQPTRFEARRHWGVFAVKVPADFGKQTVTWTLKVHGDTFAIPGSLHPDWEIDALAGEAGHAAAKRERALAHRPGDQVLGIVEAGLLPADPAVRHAVAVERKDQQVVHDERDFAKGSGTWQ